MTKLFKTTSETTHNKVFSYKSTVDLIKRKPKNETQPKRQKSRFANWSLTKSRKTPQVKKTKLTQCMSVPHYLSQKQFEMSSSEDEDDHGPMTTFDLIKDKSVKSSRSGLSKKKSRFAKIAKKV